ncbi:hypothetical protein D9619_010977 [Psilocybe cf. subviscida]|uniref:NAD(P)-binding protein n=1 Tax=Psilocybe cf. subviscida TaxID=2480587 RepID=A0A8H5F0C8_9AGAR|nr:hypothetical protein D9619_010977 [Psilocybe cf. subviscida]
MFGPSFNPQRDLPYLTGKVAFVTGANHGIGLETVKQLAKHGATVYLGSRSEEKGLAAVASIEAHLANDSKAGKVFYHNCDLATPALAKQSAERLAEKVERLDILSKLFLFDSFFKSLSVTPVNNAGLLADGAVADQIIMVNHFGTFQITKSLLPLLIKTSKLADADVRIIWLASEAQNLTRGKDPNLKFATLQDFNTDYSSDWWPAFSRYSVSKLLNVLDAKAFQKNLDADGHSILCISVHPGAINTFSDRYLLTRILAPIINLFFRTPAQGAWNSLFAAASPIVRSEPDRFKGAYLVPVGKPGPLSINATKEGLQDDVWDTTHKVLEKWETEGFDAKNPYA